MTADALGMLGFDEEEYRARLAAVRAHMAVRELDLCLVSTPENIFYLTGLDHWGYFVPHVLIVPQDGEMVLVTRQMERVTVANQVRHAAFQGYEDHETAADVVVRLLGDRARAQDRVGSAAAAVVDALGPRPQRPPHRHREVVGGPAAWPGRSARRRAARCRMARCLRPDRRPAPGQEPARAGVHARGGENLGCGHGCGHRGGP